MPSYSPFWGDGLTLNNSYSLLVNKMPRRNSIRGVVNREGFRPLTELFVALLGTAVGGPALVTHKRIAAIDPTLVGNLGISGGGNRTIETITDISRVTTTADVTALKEMVNNVTHRPSTYPKDLSGNGGPSY